MLIYVETRWLRRASQINDRQVLPPPMIAHIKANGSATVACDWRVRRCAGRTARPSRARCVPRTLTCRQHIMIDLMRCLTSERRVRTFLIEPFRIKRQFPVERRATKWHEDPARAFVLETQDDSFNERDTAMLADGAEAGCDPLAITPILEHAAPELLALVADNVFDNGAFEEGLNRYRCGIIPEYRKTHSASGVVINDNRHPPAKRPALG